MIGTLRTTSGLALGSADEGARSVFLEGLRKKRIALRSNTHRSCIDEIEIVEGEDPEVAATRQVMKVVAEEAGEIVEASEAAETASATTSEVRPVDIIDAVDIVQALDSADLHAVDMHQATNIIEAVAAAPAVVLDTGDVRALDILQAAEIVPAADDVVIPTPVEVDAFVDTVLAPVLASIEPPLSSNVVTVLSLDATEKLPIQSFIPPNWTRILLVGVAALIVTLEIATFGRGASTRSTTTTATTPPHAPTTVVIATNNDSPAHVDDGVASSAASSPGVNVDSLPTASPAKKTVRSFNRKSALRWKMK